MRSRGGEALFTSLDFFGGGPSSSSSSSSATVWMDLKEQFLERQRCRRSTGGRPKSGPPESQKCFSAQKSGGFSLYANRMRSAKLICIE